MYSSITSDFLHSSENITAVPFKDTLTFSIVLICTYIKLFAVTLVLAKEHIYDNFWLSIKGLLL